MKEARSITLSSPEQKIVAIRDAIEYVCIAMVGGRDVFVDVSSGGDGEGPVELDVRLSGDKAGRLYGRGGKRISLLRDVLEEMVVANFGDRHPPKINVVKDE